MKAFSFSRHSIQIWIKQSSFPIAEAQVLSPVEPHMTNMKSSLSQVRSESLQSSARNAYTMLQVVYKNMLHWVEGKFKQMWCYEETRN